VGDGFNGANNLFYWDTLRGYGKVKPFFKKLTGRGDPLLKWIN
jgi:hypothetical protein